MYIAYNLDSANKIWSWVNVLYWILSCCLTPALSVLRYNRYRVPALLEEGETPFLQEESQDRLWETDKIFIIQPRWVKVCPGGLIKSAIFWIQVNFVMLDLNTLNWIHLWMKLSSLACRTQCKQYAHYGRHIRRRSNLYSLSVCSGSGKPRSQRRDLRQLGLVCQRLPSSHRPEGMTVS